MKACIFMIKMEKVCNILKELNILIPTSIVLLNNEVVHFLCLK